MKIQTEGKISIAKIAEDMHKVFSKWNKKPDRLFSEKVKFYKYNGIEVCLNPMDVVRATERHYTQVRLLGNYLFCVLIPLNASKEEIANLFREAFNKSLLELHNKAATLEKMLGVEKK